MGVFDDMNKLMQMKAAMAMEKASEAESSGAGMGMGTGLGLMMPAMFAQYFSGANGAKKPGAADEFPCPECHNEIPANAKFCPYCGHQQLVIRQCTSCGKNVTASAKFCSRCGHPTEEKPNPKQCSKCNQENLPDSKFCGGCGEKI